MFLAPGTVVDGKFRVLHKLGEGGMGVVMAADHLQLRSQVAIKLLKREASDVRLERFMREARALAQLETDHVTRVFDVGNLATGEPYIVMELLSGEDLSAMSKRLGAIAPRDVVDYIMQACVGLSEAHAIGIVHRDIKPANLFFASLRDGRRIIKVLDFGISKVNEVAKDRATALTDTGAMLGSPHYMSPEQLRGLREVDHRADIWSLGATIYRLITGSYAFDAPSVAEIAIEVLTKPPPSVQASVPEAPTALEAIVGRCLARAPEHRFQTVAELAVALAPLGSAESAQALERIRAGLQGRGLALPVPASKTEAMAGLTQDVAPVAAPQAMLAPTVDDGTSGMRVSAMPSSPGQAMTAQTTTGQPSGGFGYPQTAATAGYAPVGPAGGSPKRSAWPWLLAGAVGLVALGVGAVAVVMAGDEETSAASTRDRAPKKKASGDDEADAPSGRRVALAEGEPYYAQAPAIAKAVRGAHGGPLKIYDALFFEDRARFVVESKSEGLVRYEVQDGRVSGAERHELPSTSRLDNLLLDSSVLKLDVVGRIAADAPRRLGRAGSKAHSVSLHRISQGVVWVVSLKTGESAHYNFAGQPVK